tara:strand:+ start:30186 stop:30608 length:423 start_codon:yes stop_codon:yes gene_type:complete
MSDKPDTTSPDDKAKNSATLDDLQVWGSWLEQVGTISADIFQLLQLELRLAISDSKRLFVLALLFVPVLILTWLGFSVLLAWQVYLLNMSVTQCLLAFCIIQILALLSMIVGWNYYKKSLSLPLSRQHIRRFIGGEGRDT